MTKNEIPEGWSAGSFMVHGPDMPEGNLVAGWLKPPFGLVYVSTPDHPIDIGGWGITHLKTGYSCGVWNGYADEVMALAEAMAVAADWSFESLDRMPPDTKNRLTPLWAEYGLDRRTPSNQTLIVMFSAPEADA